MTKENLNTITKLTEELLAVPHCCQELKDAASTWLSSVGKKEENDAAKAYVAELEEDVMPVDDTIEFFKSEAAVNHFGAHTAAQLLNSLIEHKKNGGKYCNCAACAAGAAVLEYKDILLR